MSMLVDADGQALAGMIPESVYVDVPFSKSVPANNGEVQVVTPTAPSGHSTILCASVIFTSVNHFIWHDLANSNGEWRIYLHNTYSSAQTISGYVRYVYA